MSTKSFKMLKGKPIWMPALIILALLITLAGCTCAEKATNIKVSIEPNPVPYQDGYWSCIITFTEVDGIGVKLSSLSIGKYTFNKSWIEQHLGSAYLPPYGSLHFQSNSPQPRNQIMISVTGIDDMGHKIKATGKVRFLQPRETAKIEISFEPNPVFCKDGLYSWKTILREVNGIGVKLNSLAEDIYDRNGKLAETKKYDSSMIEEKFSSDYLSGLESLNYEAKHLCQKIAYEKITISGVDDKGYSITASDIIFFISAEGEQTAETAEIEMTFEPNPVPCKNGEWLWKVILTEANEIGVMLTSISEEMYGPHGLIVIKHYQISTIEKWYGSAYLPPYGSLSCGSGFPCQAITYEIVTFTGISDNGDEVVVKGRIDFLQPKR